MHSDHALGRPSPIPRMHRVDSFISVIRSDDEHGVRGALEDLPGQIFSLVALGNLTFQVAIRSSQLRRSLRDSEFKLISPSAPPAS